MKESYPNKTETVKKDNPLALGIAFGIAIGAAIGVATDNIAMWLSLGMQWVPQLRDQSRERRKKKEKTNLNSSLFPISNKVITTLLPIEYQVG